MGQNPGRPLSPHLQIYKWGPHMAISIFHRATGFVLATAGMMTLLWWLSAIGGGPESYATFQKYVVSAGADGTTWQVVFNWFFRLVALAVTYSFFQHLFSGLRHFVLDIGAGYELKTNRSWSLVVFIAALAATALVVLVTLEQMVGRNMGNGTELGRVRGLGSAKHGSHHWIHQRTTAVGNLLLTVWLGASLFLLPNFEQETLANWLAQPLVAVPMILMLISIFWHLRLGLQVFIEDYVHEPAPKVAAMIALNFYAVAGCVFGIFTVAKLAFAGVPA